MKPKKQVISLQPILENKTSTEIPKKVFLICPECHTESKIREFFSGDLFFISCLGLAFKDHSDEFIAQLQFLIEQENISEIIIAADDQCNITKSSLTRFSESDNPSTVSQSSFPLLRPEELQFYPEEKKAERFTNINLLRQYLFITTGLVSKLKCAGRRITVSALIYQHKSNLFIAQTLPEIITSN